MVDVKVTWRDVDFACFMHLYIGLLGWFRGIWMVYTPLVDKRKRGGLSGLSGTVVVRLDRERIGGIARFTLVLYFFFFFRFIGWVGVNLVVLE